MAKRKKSPPVDVADADDTDGKAESQKRGEADGKAGKTPDPGYPAGTDLHKEYMDAYTRANISNLGLPPEEVEKLLSQNADAPAPDIIWNDDLPHLTGDDEK